MKKSVCFLLYLCAFFSACEKYESIQEEEDAEFTNLSVEDVLISEILPDPWKDGVEFIEIYNHSSRLVDLSTMQIATTNSNGKRSKLHPISGQSSYLYPFTYKLLSSNSDAVQAQYPFQGPNTFQEMSSFPTLTNTQGAVLLFRDDQLIDSLFYTAGMHDVFIKNAKGVSLERVNFTKETNSRDNFISAAATSGYATPGYRNSQLERPEIDDTIFLSSKSFAPDRGEVLEINLLFPKGGKMANVFLFNRSGKRVHSFLNKRLGVENQIIWNGKDKGDKTLAMGTYHVLIELYDSKGILSTWKDSFILVGNL